MAVVRRELRPQLGEIQNRIDRAHQVIGRNTLFEIKPVENRPCDPERSPIIAASIDSSKINGITFMTSPKCRVFQQNSPGTDIAQGIQRVNHNL